jgi:hypothetical protein
MRRDDLPNPAARTRPRDLIVVDVNSWPMICRNTLAKRPVR